MKKILSFLLIIVFVLSCKENKQQVTAENDLFPVKYENDLFSISLPQGWECDDSGWHGLDALYNTVDIYDSNGNVVWFHMVKTLMPIQWKNVDEAKEMAKGARLTSGDPVELIREIDSVEVGGYPTCILYFANHVNSETIIQKQFVTYLQDSHIVIYINENFYMEDWNEAQVIGDAIISTIQLKQVTNPLENDSIFRKIVKEGLEKQPVEEKYRENAKRILEEYENSK